MGWDENDEWFYGIIGGTELDHWLGKSTYADNNSRHFDEARYFARKQAEGECPLVYLAEKSDMAATCIEWGNPENMLVTTMIEGLTQYWYYQLYNKQMAHDEKVYTSYYELIYAAENRHKVWQRQTADKERGGTTEEEFTVGKDPYIIDYKMDAECFALQSRGKLLGGTLDSMGIGGRFACTHCRDMGHSMEFCFQKRYKRGSQPRF
jgi:hypothetical protein